MGGHCGGSGQVSSLSSLSLETVFSRTRVSVSVTWSNVATFSLFRELSSSDNLVHEKGLQLS